MSQLRASPEEMGFTAGSRKSPESFIANGNLILKFTMFTFFPRCELGELGELGELCFNFHLQKISFYKHHATKNPRLTRGLPCLN
jgi:hypothetical protein